MSKNDVPCPWCGAASPLRFSTGEKKSVPDSTNRLEWRLVINPVHVCPKCGTWFRADAIEVKA